MSESPRARLEPLFPYRAISLGNPVCDFNSLLFTSGDTFLCQESSQSLILVVFNTSQTQRLQGQIDNLVKTVVLPVASVQLLKSTA